MINYLYSLGKNILKTANISMLLSLKDFFFFSEKSTSVVKETKMSISRGYGKSCESCWLASDFFESSLYFLNFVLAISTSRISSPPGRGYTLDLPGDPYYPDTVVHLETLFRCYHLKCFSLSTLDFSDRMFFWLLVVLKLSPNSYVQTLKIKLVHMTQE